MSPNPGGRRAGALSFAERVRQRVDPDVLIDRAVSIISDPKTSKRDAVAAMAFLHATAWQKPAEKHEVAAVQPERVDEDAIADRLTDAELDALDELDRKRDEVLAAAAARDAAPRLPATTLVVDAEDER
ncbi:MAG TPA: hypothetical protein VGG74_14815 [Kofleriaceae bacterium]